MSYYIIIRGHLGSGKSAISEKVSKKLKARYFAVDRVLDEFDLVKYKEKGYISQKSFFRTNDVIAKRSKEFLDKGIPVIFDGNFYWKSAIEDLIGKLDYPHKVFTLKLPLKDCIERDSKRKKTHGKDAAMVVYNKSTEFSYGKIIDSKKPLGESVREIINELKDLKRKVSN